MLSVGWMDEILWTIIFPGMLSLYGQLDLLKHAVFLSTAGHWKAITRTPVILVAELASWIFLLIITQKMLKVQRFMLKRFCTL